MSIFNRSILALGVAFALAACDMERKDRVADVDKPGPGTTSPSGTAGSTASPGSTTSPSTAGSTGSSSASGPSSSPGRDPASTANSTDSGSATPGAAGRSGTSGSTNVDSSSTVGKKMDDTAITSKVKTALMADPDIKGMSINVTTMKGEVKLEGKVASEDQVKKAMEIARGVDGVTAVQNNLEVKAAS